MSKDPLLTRLLSKYKPRDWQSTINGLFVVALACVMGLGTLLQIDHRRLEARVVELEMTVNVMNTTTDVQNRVIATLVDTVVSIERTFGSLVEYLEAREMIIDWNKEASYGNKP